MVNKLDHLAIVKIIHVVDIKPETPFGASNRNAVADEAETLWRYSMKVKTAKRLMRKLDVKKAKGYLSNGDKKMIRKCTATILQEDINDERITNDYNAFLERVSKLKTLLDTIIQVPNERFPFGIRISKRTVKDIIDIIDLTEIIERG